MARRRLKRHLRAALGLGLGLLLLGFVLGRLLLPSTRPELRNQATRAYGAGDYLSAVTLVSRALESTPASKHAERADLLTIRGLSNLELGRHRSAVDDLREARRLAPEEEDPWIREGQALLELRQFADDG